jgi:hypothetical protein
VRDDVGRLGEELEEVAGVLLEVLARRVRAAAEPAPVDHEQAVAAAGQLLLRREAARPPAPGAVEEDDGLARAPLGDV